MGVWHEAAPLEETEPERSGGERLALYGLRLAAGGIGLGALFYLGLDLRHTGGSLGWALANTIPGLLVAGAFIPAIRRVHDRRYLAAAAFAALATALALFAVAVYIDSLAGLCKGLSGCTQRGATLYLLTSAQLLLVCGLASGVLAAVACLGAGFARRDR